MCSSVWPERGVWGAEVGGSNPPTQTNREKDLEEKAVEIARSMFKDIILNARDIDEAIDELREDVVEELELTRKETTQLDNLLNDKKVTFLQAMNLLGKALDNGYYLMDDEIEPFDFIFEEEYNRKFRKVKSFIRNWRKFN